MASFSFDDARKGALTSVGRRAELANLMSETTQEERLTLHAFVRHCYQGAGAIVDIGAAAGGSSYCMAAGLIDGGGKSVVRALDLFNGYSCSAFKEQMAARGLSAANDIDLFAAHTRAVSTAVEPVAVDLLLRPEAIMEQGPVEIAHIDAAKSLALWKAIFANLAPTVIPGQTVWIFQDFERVRLPWQLYGLAGLLQYGELIGGAPLGTLYFRIRDPIGPEELRRIAGDAFTFEEKSERVAHVIAFVRAHHADLFAAPDRSFDDYDIGWRAYLEFWFGSKERARTMYRNVSPGFMTSEPYYARELGVTC